MITSELRNKKGAYKSQKIRDLAADIDKVMKTLYKKHKGKVSYDTLYLMITDSAYLERTFGIAFDATK